MESGSESAPPAASATNTNTTNTTAVSDAGSQIATTQPQQQQQVQQQQQQAFTTHSASAGANPTISPPPASAQAPPATKAGARGGAAGGEGGAGKKGKGAAPRKNAKNTDPVGVGMQKKPSPRARTAKAAKAGAAADSGEAGAGKKKVTAAEKKKAAAAQATPPASNGVPAKQDAQPASESAAAASTPSTSNTELLPAHDNDLRKAYLQQIYRQLQISHRDQDDSVIRQVATNMEMEVCRKATSRSEYISALNYELNKLMQTEISRGGASSNNNNNAAYGGGANANANAKANAQAQCAGSSFNGYQGAQTSESMPAQSADLSGTKSSTANPARQPDYTEKQKQVHTQGQSHSKGAGATGPSVSEGSFMQSLLSDQNPMATYTQSKGHVPGASVYSATNTAMQQSGLESSVQPSSSHGYAQNALSQGHTPSAADIQMQQAYQLQQQQRLQQLQQQQQQQQQQQLPRQSRPISPNASLPEFAAQVQHFDKNSLIELLWSQRNSLIQWQRRASQLEAQLSARYNPGASTMPSPYYNGTPPGAQAYGSGVPQTVSNEAELQRVNMRRDARIQQQQQYPVQHPQYAGGSNGSPMTNSPGGQAGGPVNPMLYWEKVRALKSGFAQDLYLAHRVLSQHNAAPNSAQSLKAENVKHNISLAMNVLNETPKNIQPRPFEVLNSIERFIQNTIIPIVQKVQPVVQNSQQPSPAGPSSYQNSPANASAGMNMARSVGSGGPSPGAGNGNFNQAPAAYQAHSAGLPAQAPAKGDKSSGRGKKAKTEQTGGPKMPPRAKQNAEGKPKKLSKAAEAKLAAQQSAQQAAVRMADGHQSPFGAGVNALEKMPTPTVSPSGNRTMSVVEDSAKAMALDAANKNAVEDADDDALNDFDDFPELDFDEEMPSMKVQFNKENNSYNTKKRSVGDV